MENDDAALVRRVLAGETEAYRTLVKRHQERIFYVGLKFFRRFEDAEDFAQEVFLRAFERLASFAGQGSFAGWLYRVAFNLAVNSYRRARSKLVDELRQEALADADPASDVEGSVVSAESAGRINEALERLPNRYALIVKMHFFDGLSYPEIADILDMPVNTVKSHVFRAKGLIRSLLAEYMED